MSNQGKNPHHIGSLPNYIVNLPELSGIIEDAFTGDFEDGCIRDGIQRSKGFYILSESQGVEIATWEIPYDIDLTGITFGQEEVRNMGYDDYINIYIDDDLVFETIFLKEVQEKKDFRLFTRIKEGSVIKIEYHNNTDIKKEFKIDIEYLNKAPMESPPIIPPPIIPEEPDVPEPPTELLPIYRIYLRYEGGVPTDLDIYANMFDSEDGSDISPSRTVGFSRRVWGINQENLVDVAKVSDTHLGLSDRELAPEVIEIYGRPSKYYRLYARNYAQGDMLEEEVTMDIFKVDSDGNDGLLLGSFTKEPSLFHQNDARVYFFDFAIETETLVGL